MRESIDLKEFGYSKFQLYQSACYHIDAHRHKNVSTCIEWSVYLKGAVSGIKEQSFNAYGDLPLEEHWGELINDEYILW